MLTDFMKSKFALSVLATRINRYGDGSDDEVVSIVLHWIEECEEHIEESAKQEKGATRE